MRSAMPAANDVSPKRYVMTAVLSEWVLWEACSLSQMSNSDATGPAASGTFEISSLQVGRERVMWTEPHFMGQTADPDLVAVNGLVFIDVYLSSHRLGSIRETAE